MKTLVNGKIDIRIKISALWVVLMVCYLYNDIFSMFTPGAIQEMLDGNMGPFPVTQASLIMATLLMVIPTLMIYLTLVLKQLPNRIINIILSALYIAVMVVSLIGEWWFYIIMGGVEIIVNLLIIYHAIVWQKASDVA